jgi:TDG/mug DNA glycosylase family protein
MNRPHGLPDRARPGIRALFVGINPGMRSAAIGHHFAGFSNRFWKLLYDARLVAEPLRAEDDERLPEAGYGITNLIARPTPGISDLKAEEYAAGRRALLAKVRRYRPRVVVLVGVTLYRAMFPSGGKAGASRRTTTDPPRAGAAPSSAAVRREAGAVHRATADLPSPLGLREETLGGVPVFVVPNPSGRNANFRYDEMLSAFRALEAFLETR